MGFAENNGLVVGVDTHLDQHTAALCDGRGRLVAQLQVPATAAGYARLLAWARASGAMGANLGATRANGFSCQADVSGQAAGDHASSRTDPDEAERLTGIYGSDASGGGAPARDERQDL